MTSDETVQAANAQDPPDDAPPPQTQPPQTPPLQTAVVTLPPAEDTATPPQTAPEPEPSHPWTDADHGLLHEIYGLIRTSRMNGLYYEARLGSVQRRNFWMEVVTAATASGSGLAAFATIGPAEYAWKSLSLIAAAIAIIKPIYAPSKRIEAFTRQQQGYHANYFALRKLAFAIRQQGYVIAEHRRRYDTFFDRHVQLSSEDEATPVDAVLRQAHRATNRALPPSSFWQPGDQPEPPPPHQQPPTATQQPSPPPPPPVPQPTARSGVMTFLTGNIVGAILAVAILVLLALLQRR